MALRSRTLKYYLEEGNFFWRQTSLALGGLLPGPICHRKELLSCMTSAPDPRPGPGTEVWMTMMKKAQWSLVARDGRMKQQSSRATPQTEEVGYLSNEIAKTCIVVQICATIIIQRGNAQLRYQITAACKYTTRPKNIFNSGATEIFGGRKFLLEANLARAQWLTSRPNLS